jgi:hypothetical protein
MMRITSTQPKGRLVPLSMIAMEAVFFLAVSFLSPAVAQTDIAVPPSEGVAGMSQAAWSEAWWQWAGSFEQGDSPVADRTGASCQLKQKAQVWFLAGTYGTRRTTRTCKVPRDTFLFFPLINYVSMPATNTDPCGVCCPHYVQTVKQFTDEPSNLVLELDGVRIDDLARYRQATTQCFDMGALAEPKYHVFPSATNGYYVMLRPLSPGKHVLNFGGMLPGMSQAVTYTLLVE